MGTRMNERRVKTESRERFGPTGQREGEQRQWAYNKIREMSERKFETFEIFFSHHSAIDLCLYVFLVLLECEPAPNIVLNIQPGANHLGPEDFELMLEEEALTLAFLYTELGLDPPRPPRKRKR